MFLEASTLTNAPYNVGEHSPKSQKVKKSKSLNNKPGRGRKPAFSRSSKIIIAKSLSKRHKSTRKLANILKKKGQPVSHVTIYKLIVKDLMVLFVSER